MDKPFFLYDPDFQYDEDEVIEDYDILYIEKVPYVAIRVSNGFELHSIESMIGESCCIRCHEPFIDEDGDCFSCMEEARGYMANESW